MKNFSNLKRSFVLPIVMAVSMVYSATALGQSGNTPIQKSKPKQSDAFVKSEVKGKTKQKSEEQLRFEKRQAEAKGKSTVEIDKALNELNQNLTK